MAVYCRNGSKCDFDSFVFHNSFSKTGAKKLAYMGTTLLHKIRIVRHKEKAEKKLDALLESYKEGAEYMRTHGKVAVVVFFTTCVQRISYFAVTWFVYTALGGKGFSVLEIIMLQSFVSVCIDILPFPGGVGANEGFLWLFLHLLWDTAWQYRQCFLAEAQVFMC